MKHQFFQKTKKSKWKQQQKSLWVAGWVAECLFYAL
jgi:hypothetical protein